MAGTIQRGLSRRTFSMLSPKRSGTLFRMAGGLCDVEEVTGEQVAGEQSPCRSLKNPQWPGGVTGQMNRRATRPRREAPARPSGIRQSPPDDTGTTRAQPLPGGRTTG